jgi:hypothetical protein
LTLLSPSLILPPLCYQEVPSKLPRGSCHPSSICPVQNDNSPPNVLRIRSKKTYLLIYCINAIFKFYW